MPEGRLRAQKEHNPDKKGCSEGDARVFDYSHGFNKPGTIKCPVTDEEVWR